MKQKLKFLTLGCKIQSKPNLFFLLIALMLTPLLSEARTWYINKNQNGTVLQNLINGASNGDVIYFIDRADYNMGNIVLNVNKSITFQGATPTGVNLNTRGSSGTLTRLINLTSVKLRSNNITFNNIKLVTTNQLTVLIDGRSDRYAANFTNPGYAVDDQWTGINFNNVEINGGFYGCFAGNGMQANFTNVSFINFDKIGYIVDRRTRVNGMKRQNFTKCAFLVSATPTGFDSRGISLDAGNTEYPIVWNAENSTIDNCLFVDTGIALSRIRNVDIINSTFNDGTALVDLIHVEEFSNDILIQGNTFQGNATPAAPRQFERSRIVNMDFELQPVDNIRILNNTVTGQYNYFANGYAPTNITITGNNLTAATPFNNNIINFDYYENRTKPGETLNANQEFVSRGITITNNTGFANGGKGCIVRVPSAGGGNINIANAQFVNAAAVNRISTNDPTPLTGSGIYELRNAGNTNRELASNGNTLVTKASSTTNNTTRWRVTWVPPHFYYIQNVANNRYLETHKGYTESEIQNNVAQNVTPFLGTALSSSPRWILREGGTAALFKLLPGGNEKQSVLNMNGTNPGLIFHKRFTASGVREVLEPNNFGKWWFMWQSASKSENGKLVDDTFSKALTVFKNPASGIISMYYEDDAHPIVSVDFYSISGVKVKTEKVSSHVNTHIDVSHLSSGVYIAQSSNGTTKKFIID